MYWKTLVWAAGIWAMLLGGSGESARSYAADAALRGLPVDTLTADRPDIRFRRLTLADGLSQGHITDIVEDRRGFLWIATQSGLNRYDGYQVKVYNPNPFDTTSLSDGTIDDLHLGRGGVLWITTRFGGLNRMDLQTETFQQFQHDPDDPSSLLPGYVMAVFEDARGVLWVGTRHGLSRMTPEQPGTFVHYRHDPDDPNSLSENRIRSIREGPGDTLWIATANGLNRMSLHRPGHFTRFLYGSAADAQTRAIPHTSLHEQYVDPARPHIRWIGSDHGLIRFNATDGSSTRFLPYPNRGPSANEVRTASPDPSMPGVLWLSIHNNGIARFDPRTQTFTRYRSAPTNRHGLVEHAGTVTFTDRSGMVWVGADGGGLGTFNPSAMKVAHYTSSASNEKGPHAVARLRNANVWGLAMTTDRMLWAGTSEGYLHRINPRTGAVRVWKARPTAPSPTRPSGTAYAFAEAPHGDLWIGTGRGLDRYQPDTERFVRYRHVAGDTTTLSSNNINDLYRAADGTLWVATMKGLNRFNPASGTFTRYLHDPADSTSLASDWVGFVYRDRAERLWVATQNAVSRFHPATGQFTHYRHVPNDPTSLTNGRFAWIHERAREPGILWIASIDGGGLDRLDTRTGTVTHFTTETSDLPDNTVYAIQEDARGRLWLSTNHGLVRFTPDAPAPRRAFRSFGRFSGLQGLEFNQHAAAHGPEGRLLFGGTNGFNVFQPSALARNAVPPRVIITGLEVLSNGATAATDSLTQQAVRGTKPLRVPHDQNEFTVAYVGVHFKAPRQNRYRYKLVGYDEKWIAAGARREATYTNVPPGTYHFKVHAANADGVWSEQAASVTIAIAPPWWRTWLAYVVYGGVIVGGLLAMFYGQRRRLERRQRTLERTVHARTQALRQEKKKTEQQAVRLREMDRLKTRFFTNVSHEFRTPLTLTIGPLEDVKRALSTDGEVSRSSIRQNVTLALRNSRRLLRLIGQLLDVAKLEDGALTLDAQQNDLVSFVRELARSFVPLAERRRVRFVFEGPATPLPVVFDRAKLEQVFTNLLSNAFKFTPRDGTIHMRVAIAASTDDEAPEPHAVAVTVRDNGPGIPPEDLPHLFDRFYQSEQATPDEAPGTGIGLSLAKDLVELHRGTIALESAPGEGTTGIVRLPLAAAPAEGSDGEQTVRVVLTDGMATANDLSAEGKANPKRPDVRAAFANPASGDGASDDRTTLLVADDNPEIRAYIRSHFADTYRIVEARDGREALERAHEDLPDLIISDVMMPRLDGFALVEALRSDRATDFLPVILLTARAAEHDKLAGLREGADAYLTKPFNMEELQTRVKNLMAAQQRLKARFAAEPSDETSGSGGPPTVTPAASPPAEDAPAEPPYVVRARAIVRDHLADEEFGVAELADALAQSRSTVYRRFRDLRDQSPSAFLREERLARAAALLRTQEGTVSEVAYAVGFKSVSHFSEAFQAMYDVRPSDYLAQPTSAPTAS